MPSEEDYVVEQRRAVREMQHKGWVRCDTYLGNMLRMNDLPFEEKPAALGTAYWIPVWLEWHMLRFREGVLKDVPMRERLAQARALLEDKQAQLDLLCEAQLAGGTLNDPDGDLSTMHAIARLQEELGA